MITISKQQLGQVEYLIDQSIQGFHVLFSSEAIREIFQRESPLAHGREGTEFEMEKHIEKLLAHDTLEKKRAYLESLDPITYEQVVRSYFNIVENNLYENPESRH